MSQLDDLGTATRSIAATGGGAVAQMDDLGTATRRRSVASGVISGMAQLDDLGTLTRRVAVGGNVPADMIAYFAATPGAGWAVCDGAGGTPNFITDGLYLKGGAAFGAGAVGAHTHEHVYSGNSGGDGGRAGQNCYDDGNHNNVRSHVHSLAHTHAATDHQPPYAVLIPALSVAGALLGTDARMWFDGTSLPMGWSAVSALYGKYPKSGAAAGATGGATTHSHTISVNTGTTNPPYDMDYDLQQATNPKTRIYSMSSHAHSANHTHAATANVPPYYKLVPISPDAATGTIPAGVVAAFKTAPSTGWTAFAAINSSGLFVLLDSVNGSPSGSSQHGHTLGATASGGGAAGQNAAGASQPTVVGSHTHDIAHTHSTVAGNSEPKHWVVVFYKKD